MARPKSTPRKKKSAQRYHHGDLRRASLQLVKEWIEKEGIDAVTMKRLAQQLGVSVAAPFRHFPTKDALLVALAEQGAQALVQRMAAASAGCPDPLDAQRAQGVAYVRFAVEEPAYFALLSHPAVLSASDQLQAQAAAMQAQMDPVLGRHHPGDASTDLVKRSAGMLAAQALTYGLARMINDRLLGSLSAQEAETLAMELTGVLGEGLLPRP